MGNGALIKLGGELFKSIFIPSSGQQVKIEFSIVITDLIQKIEKIIKKKMNPNELRLLKTEVEAIQQNMIHYMNNPAQEDRLFDATTSITSVVAQLKGLNKLGFQAYAIAVNMQILILQERIKKYGSAERINLKEAIVRATEHVEDVRKLFFKWHHARYTNLRRQGSPRSGTYYYDFEGRTNSISVAQLIQWFINRGAPLKDGITNYDGAFSLHLTMVKRDKFNVLAHNEISPIENDLKRIWRNIRKKTK